MANPATDNKVPELAGVVGFFATPDALIEGVKKVRAANYESFDAFTPYPIHGLEKVQGLKRSWLPFVTLGAGLTGFFCAVALQGWTSVISWPLNVGGKPLWSWPAFVPIFFELTVLFAGLATVGAMFIANGLPNIKKKAFDSNITRDKFAIMIDAPRIRTKEELEEMDTVDVKRYHDRMSRYKAFSESEAMQFLKGAGASEVRSVPAQGWF